MLTIQLTFPAGRYHATPWGRQVNEGAVEWPPSPWRLLRAFLAVWHHKLPDVGEDAVHELIHALAAAPPPLYRLPVATAGHTRHYMPIGADKKHPGGNTTKVFDTFFALDRDPKVSAAFIEWDVDLDADQSALLDRLLSGLTYLGRAESWVTAQRVEHADEQKAPCRVVPLEKSDLAVGENELFQLLAPETPAAFEAKLSAVRGKSRKGQSVNTVLDALHAETAALRKAGWSRPPGSRWVDYARPINPPQVDRPAVGRGTITREPTVARYAVHCRALPRLTDAILYGEAVRKAVMSKSKKLEGNADAIFSGKAAHGGPAEGHQHAHFLPEANETEAGRGGRGGTGRITHITVFAPDGFDEPQRRALSAAATVYGRQGHPLRLVLLGFGEHRNPKSVPAGRGGCRLFASSDIWVSRTPFVPTRHLKKNRPRDEQFREWILRELQARDWLADAADALESITPILHTKLGGKETRWLAFRRWRSGGGGTRAGAHAYGFRLTFRKPIRGPIALGYGSHFGLGQFEPGTDTA